MKEETEKNEPFGTVTDSYVCIYPEEAQQVFSYLEGLNPSLKDIVQRHLHFCIHCREKVTNRILRNQMIEDLDQLLFDNTNDEIELADQENNNAVVSVFERVEGSS